jgi:hypothetical protein
MVKREGRRRDLGDSGGKGVVNLLIRISIMLLVTYSPQHLGENLSCKYRVLDIDDFDFGFLFFLS